MTAGAGRALTLALLAAIVAGCDASVPPQAAGRTLLRPHLRFALDAPEGWTVRDLEGDVVLELVPPEEPAPQADAPEEGARRRGPPVVFQVTVIDRKGLTLEAWAEATVREARGLQSDLEADEPAPAKLADGRAALRLVLRNPRGVEPLEQRMLLVMTGRSAYGLLATGTAAGLARHEAALGTCFDTFVAW